MAVPSRDDDVATGEERGTEVFESCPDDDRRVRHDLEGAATVSEQQGGEVPAEAAGAVQDRCWLV